MQNEADPSTNVVIGVGEYFGERSLLTDQPISTSILAKGSETELMFLTKADFQQFQAKVLLLCIVVPLRRMRGLWCHAMQVAGRESAWSVV